MTKEPVARNFVGIPIVGTRRETSLPPDQDTPEHFEGLVRDVLADPLIKSFGWIQYTPYFNDGDVCEFEVRDIWFHTTDSRDQSREDAECPYAWMEEREVNFGPHLILGGFEWRGEGPLRERVYVGEHEETFMKCYRLHVALENGRNFIRLGELFGDHCEITVSRDGIVISEYSSHD